MLIESCCGGGGRFDAGMLYYSPQIWCSDDTDAIERISIQHGTSFGYPISAVGSHVSAIPNHQTGRRTDYRLTNSVQNNEIAAWMFVSKNQQKALLNVVSLNAHGNSSVSYVQCRGLDKDATYVCEKANGCKYEKQVYSGSGLMSIGLPVPRELGEYGTMQMKLLKL